MTQGAHKRQNLLTGDWVLVSPHRLQRPWQGAMSEASSRRAPSHDPACYLCAGNARVGGVRNPDYRGVYVFDNDFPALLDEADQQESGRILIAERETGVCRVICYSEDHASPMSHLPVDAIERVVDTWVTQTDELSRRPDIGAVTIFENRGEMMGASNPHPHGQIWATRSTPNELAREAQRQSDWREANGRPMLAEYLESELASGERIVCMSDHFVAVVPFWAAWPFETLLLPRRTVSSLPALTGQERSDLARILSRLTRLYDAVFDAPFPYTFGWHQRPARISEDAGFTLHAHFYPPLLRSATIRKFMVGFEMLGMPQRDLTPEAAALALREAGRRIG